MSKKKLFTVLVPVVGHCIVEVEAKDNDEAIDLAIENADVDNPDELSPMHQIMKGNTFYGTENEAHVLDEQDISDDGTEEGPPEEESTFSAEAETSTTDSGEVSGAEG